MFHKKYLLYFSLILILLISSREFLIWRNEQRADLEVFFLDVGQGDAILISYQKRYQILIDGGPNIGALSQRLGEVMPFMDKTIEIIVLTHPDLDHATGLISALENYQVKLFLDNGQISDQEILGKIQQLILDKKIKRKVLLADSQIEIADNLKLKVFNPEKIVPAGKERNDQSVVLRMDYGKNSFLFTGDAEFQAEAKMISHRDNLDVDILKVGHHGSKGSTSVAFLNKITPKMAIISAGKNNRYGHPTEKVLKKLKKREIQILRTDKQGTIKLSCWKNKKCIFDNKK